MLLLNITIVSCAALFSAGLALIWLRRSSAPQSATADDAPLSLLFEDGILHHASDRAVNRFALKVGADEWEDLREKVIAAFPDFPVRPTNTAHGDARLHGRGKSGASDVVISWRGAMTHVTFHDAQPENVQTHPATEALAELETLRNVNASIPHPVWQTDGAGNVIWHNRAYQDTWRRAKGTPLDRHVPLFSDVDLGDIPPEGRRASLRTIGSDKSDWFCIVRAAQGDGAIYNASCLNAVVKAEEAQRNFVQTLAKTFAHLSIGLAIFDRNRQLALFNPALTDLTALPAKFLSARPTMLSFFDGLRENRRMPEPKNYRTWRQELAEVIAAASDGRYQETWSLDSNQTYKVSGRPHPDGATAFVFEDISAEVSITRNFRAELELAQCLLDNIEDGLAVFSASGRLIFSNIVYRELWGIDPESSFVDFTITDSISAWKRHSAPNPMWQDVENFVLRYGDRQPFDIPVQIKDRDPMSCQVAPIVSGATLIRFRKGSTTDPRSAPELEFSG